MEETVNICFVFDDKFADLWKVTMLSIDRNTQSKLAIHIVDCGISEENLKKIAEFQTKCNNVVSINIKKPDKIDVFEKFPLLKAFSSAIFYRLAIPRLFPELERVIYLDCDIIATGDIVELWNENLDGRPFGAVEEDGNFFDHSKTRASFGMPDEKKYFNSGVLLIDCKNFEESKIFSRVFDFLSKTDLKLSWPEQDALNICLDKDEHLSLPIKYGFLVYTPVSKKLLPKINPVLLHYAVMKPWNMHRPTIQFLKALKLFPYTTFLITKFWEYADQIDNKRYSSIKINKTATILYRNTVKPFERFFIKKIRTPIVKFFRKK